MALELELSKRPPSVPLLILGLPLTTTLNLLQGPASAPCKQSLPAGSFVGLLPCGTA